MSEMQPVRVLHVLNNLGYGGAETFVMNVYRHVERSKVQFDFLIRSNQNGPMLQEIESLGGQVIELPPFPGKALSNYRALDKFLKVHADEYEAMHVHANALIYVKPLQLAKKYGIPCRIIHSHSTGSRFKMLHMANTKRVSHWATHRFACSSLAGEWMFPDEDYEFVPNGIDLEKFAFSETDRRGIRRQYDIENSFVVGHVGRFVPQKNHPFIVEVFEALHKKSPNAVLLLVGDGENLDSIKTLVKSKGLSESVVFVGAVENVEKYYSAMDCFLFPSVCEGLGIVLVEAQANGLPCLVSEAVTQEVNLGLITYLSLACSPDQWSKSLAALEREREEDDSWRMRNCSKYLTSLVGYKTSTFRRRTPVDWAGECS